MDSAPVIVIPNIEAELNKSSGITTGASPLKACLFNLIIYSEGEHRSTHMHKLIEQFVGRFPCRILHIACHPDSPTEYLKVSVLSELLGPSDTPIYCDQVVVETTPLQMHRVPYLLLPNLVSELPIFLLWEKDPIQEVVIFPFFEKLAARLVFDSDCSHDLQLFSQEVLERMKGAKLQWVDVAWSKTSGWRNIFAETFDCQERLQDLNEVESIKIVYSTSDESAADRPEREALYFQAWLASRFRWKPVQSRNNQGVVEIFYNSGEKDIKVTLEPENNGKVEPGRFLAIEINGEGKMVYFKAHGEDASKVVVHISCPETCELPFNFTLPSGKKKGGLVQELFFEPPTKQWIEALSLLTRISWGS